MLLIGEAPNKRMEQAGTFHHALVRPDLMRLAGVNLRGFVLRFRRCNLLEHWPGRHPSGVGDLWPAAEATERALLLRHSPAFMEGSFSNVVLLGRRVASAFWPGDELPFFEWSELSIVVAGGSGPSRKLAVSVSPHPSPVNRWWQVPANVAVAKSFWSSLPANPRWFGDAEV